MKETKAKHRTVRLPQDDDARLMKLCDLSGLSVSEQLRELVRGARVISVVRIEQPTSNELVLA